MELEIIDPTTNISYTVLLNEDDYNRARDDMSFATTLLNGLIKQQESTSEALSDEITETENQNVAGPSQQSMNDCERVLGIHNIHVWQYSETLALIKSMQSHYEDLSHPKKKKHVFENCANDVVSSGYIITAAQCQIKWKSLIRSYKTAKDQKNKTGRGPSRFQFFDEMDIILGTKPSNQCEHAMESSVQVAEEQSLDQIEVVKDGDVNSENEPKNESGVKKKKNREEETVTKRKRMNYEEYVKEKKYNEAQKNKRHEERMEIERQKIENDKEKIALLKEYLRRK